MGFWWLLVLIYFVNGFVFLLLFQVKDVDFFNQVDLLYGTLADFCSNNCRLVYVHLVTNNMVVNVSKCAITVTTQDHVPCMPYIDGYVGVYILTESARARGFGFVNYNSDESAYEAIKAMDGQEEIFFGGLRCSYHAFNPDKSFSSHYMYIYYTSVFFFFVILSHLGVLLFTANIGKFNSYISERSTGWLCGCDTNCLYRSGTTIFLYSSADVHYGM